MAADTAATACGTGAAHAPRISTRLLSAPFNGLRQDPAAHPQGRRPRRRARGRVAGGGAEAAAGPARALHQQGLTPAGAARGPQSRGAVMVPLALPRLSLIHI